MEDLETEPVRKRCREDEEEEGPPAKRPCSPSSSSLHSILSLLESDEEDPLEDVSSLISSLQEELSSSSEEAEHVVETVPEGDADVTAEELAPSCSGPVGEEVIRHLLEASDDELGIPAGDEERREESGETVEEEEAGRVEIGGISNYDMFWELEEEAANYTLMQSWELFMA